MAALARRTWSEILTECVRLSGGVNYSGFDTRLKYWLCEAYFYLALCFHSFEMDVLDTSKACSTSNNEVTLPTDCFSVIAIRIRNTSGEYLGQVSPYDAASLITDYRPTEIGTPTRYARFTSTKIYLNKLPDQAYPLDILYYKKPANPDFSGSDSPATAEDMDAHIIERAMALAFNATGRPDLAAPYEQRLSEWLASQVRSSIVEQQIPQTREGRSTTKTLGGAQG